MKIYYLYVSSTQNIMAKAINDHSTPKSVVSMCPYPWRPPPLQNHNKKAQLTQGLARDNADTWRMRLKFDNAHFR